jgi:AraC-like DNA-binding protein
MINFHYHLSTGHESLRLPERFSPPALDSIERVLRRCALAWRTDQPHRAAWAASELHRLVVRYLGAFGAPADVAQRRDPLMAELQRTITSRMLERFDAGALARSLHLSVSQMNRRCRAGLGVSPQALWQQRRLAAVQRYLSDSDLSMKQIAQELGFNDQFYFSRWFKRRVGVSPREYRRAGVAV